MPAVLTEDTRPAGLGFARQFRCTVRRLSTTGGVIPRAFSPGPPATLFFDPNGTNTYLQRGKSKNAAVRGRSCATTLVRRRPQRAERILGVLTGPDQPVNSQCQGSGRPPPASAQPGCTKPNRVELALSQS